MSKQCLNCGNLVNDSAAFCSKCGSPLSNHENNFAAPATTMTREPVYNAPTAPVAPQAPVAQAPQQPAVTPQAPAFENPYAMPDLPVAPQSAEPTPIPTSSVYNLAPTAEANAAPAEAVEPGKEKFRHENEVKYISKNGKKKKKSAGKKVLTAFIIILIIAGLGVGGFLAYQKFFKAKEPVVDYSVKVLVIDPVTDSEGYEAKLNDLAKYTSLEELTISNLDNIDTEAIASAIGTSNTIKKLSFTNLGISDVTFISGMTALETLDLSESNSVRWGDVVALKEKNKELEITFTTEWSRALAEKTEEYLATVSNPGECTAYITDADDNGIPEIAVGNGTAWNYPSLYITYDNGQVVSFISVFKSMFDMSGSGENSAHFTIYKGSTFVQSEVYNDSSYSTAVWCIEEGMYILKGTATQNVTEEDDSPYFKNASNIVLEVPDIEAPDINGAQGFENPEEPLNPEDPENPEEPVLDEPTQADPAEDEIPDPELNPAELPETDEGSDIPAEPKYVIDLDAVRAAALQQLIPNYNDYQQLSYEELCVKINAVSYISSNLFETIEVAEPEEGEEETTVVAANLTETDIIAGYIPSAALTDEGPSAAAAKEMMNTFRLYYIGGEGDSFAVIGEPAYIGTAEVYDWTDYDRTGETHIEYLFGDKTSEGSFRDTAYFVNVEEKTIIKANRNTENAMVWKNGKGVDLNAASEFFSDELGVEGTPMVTVDGLYSIFFENGERSGNIYVDWDFTRAWFSDGTDVEPEVYPTDETGILS